jgi:hypothetical protein
MLHSPFPMGGIQQPREIRSRTGVLAAGIPHVWMPASLLLRLRASPRSPEIPLFSCKHLSHLTIVLWPPIHWNQLLTFQHFVSQLNSTGEQESPCCLTCSWNAATRLPSPSADLPFRSDGPLPSISGLCSIVTGHMIPAIIEPQGVMCRAWPANIDMVPWRHQ